MIKTFRTVLLLVVIMGCQNNKIDKPPKPDNLIPKDKMVEVIYDMLLISGAKGVSKRLLENNGIAPESYIYNKHNIDSLQFAQSNAYYSLDLDEYESLYNRVEKRLNEDQKKYKKEAEIDKAKKDSIRKENRARIDSLKLLNKDAQKKNSKATTDLLEKTD